MLYPKVVKPAAAHIKRKIEHAKVSTVVQKFVVPRKCTKRPLGVKVKAHNPQEAVKPQRYKPRPKRSVKNREAKPRKKASEHAQRSKQQSVGRTARRVQKYVRKTN
jgi:hypothetical protein